MDNSPAQKDFPWQPEFSPQVLEMYQYYSMLHWELAPYLHSYDEAAYETNSPIFRHMDAGNYETGLGNEIFARYITDYVSSVQVNLPKGEWINYWDEGQLYGGHAQFVQSVPLGQEPIWILNGAIIPMQVRDHSTGHGTRYSAGALTVNVFPSGHSTFQYFDVGNYWVTFDSTKSGNTLTLCTKNSAPSQALIYRVARWKKKPTSVTTSSGAVGVNQSWGSALTAFRNEQAVESSSSGWYYDSTKQHLIIKLSALGTNCPS
jgi:alpha-glucosidase (family GH31 glycosyl hydrolase)